MTPPLAIKGLWQYPGRPLRAIVDLDQLEANYRALRMLVGDDVDVIGIVKANAYGHGAIAVTKALAEAGCARVGVATVEEGLQLRKAGINLAILVLGPFDHTEVDRALAHTLELTVASIESLEAIKIASSGRNLPPTRIHLKIDTGLRRYGASPEEAVAIGRAVSSQASVHLVSVYSHFASADSEDLTSGQRQAMLFAEILQQLSSEMCTYDFTHLCNSAGMLADTIWRRQAVRTGISLYGIWPAPHLPLPAGVAPCLTLQAKVGRISAWPESSGVGYGETYTSLPGERLALVPIGYADGYPRQLSNEAWIGADGIRLPVRGRVSMDQIITGCTDWHEAAAGKIVTIAGNGSNGEPTFAELAALAGTIPYELLSTLARRVPRYYWRGGTWVAKEDLDGYQIL